MATGHVHEQRPDDLGWRQRRRYDLGGTEAGRGAPAIVVVAPRATPAASAASSAAQAPDNKPSTRPGPMNSVMQSPPVSGSRLQVTGLQRPMAFARWSGRPPGSQQR